MSVIIKISRTKNVQLLKYRHKEVLSEEIISYSYDLRGNILSVTGGTSPSTYAYDGYRLTSAQVPQTASFTHDALGRMTYDGLTGQSTAYNDLDLVRNISRSGTTLANYSYLSDGTKLEAVDGSGVGLVYRGPFVYRKNPGGSSLTLESVAFGARQYSPTLRRWMIPDPMSEKYYGISPYAFCGNNPVNFVDPDGEFQLFSNFVGGIVSAGVEYGSQIILLAMDFQFNPLQTLTFLISEQLLEKGLKNLTHNTILIIIFAKI